MTAQVKAVVGEWARFAIGIVVAALVAYFTTTGAIQTKIATLEARQNGEFSEIKATQKTQQEEILRRLAEMQIDIREIRTDARRER